MKDDVALHTAMINNTMLFGSRNLPPGYSIVIKIDSGKDTTSVDLLKPATAVNKILDDDPESDVSVFDSVIKCVAVARRNAGLDPVDLPEYDD